MADLTHYMLPHTPSAPVGGADSALVATLAALDATRKEAALKAELERAAVMRSLQGSYLPK